MVDCILCYAATYLVEQMTDPSNDAGRLMLERVRGDARGSKQVRLHARARCWPICLCVRNACTL